MRPSYGYVPAPVENILVVAGATRVAMSLGMVRVAFVPLRGPSGLLALRMMRHDERAVRHVAHDRGTRRDVNVIADHAFLRAHAELQMTPVADDDIAQPRGALDSNPRTDSAPPHDLYVRADHRIA